MSAKTTLSILFHDEAVDTVFIERSVLGTQVKFMERLKRDEHVFEQVAELMRLAEKTPTRVTLCIPRSCAIQRTLSYPAAAKDELDSMIKFEATRHVPLPEGDRLLGWSSVDTPDEKQVILNLVAARRAEVRGLIEQFEEVGVPVDEAVPFSSAVAPQLAERPTLLVLTDAGHLELCLYGLGILQDSQMLPRNMPGFSPGRVVAAVRQMVAKHKGWLGDEGISRIMVGGTEVLADGLEEELSTAFGLRVQPLELPENVIKQEDPLVQVLMVATSTLEPTLNLIEDKKRKVPISKRTLIVSGLCVLLGIELLAAYGFKTGSPYIQRKKVGQEIQEMRTATADIQEMRAKNRLFRKQLFQLEQVSSSHTSTMGILQAISDALPEDTYLNGFSSDSEELTLKGYSKEPDILPGLLMALSFVDTLSTSDIGKKEGDYHEFNISVSLRR